MTRAHDVAAELATWRARIQDASTDEASFFYRHLLLARDGFGTSDARISERRARRS